MGLTGAAVRAALGQLSLVTTATCWGRRGRRVAGNGLAPRTCTAQPHCLCCASFYFGSRELRGTLNWAEPSGDTVF